MLHLNIISLDSAHFTFNHILCWLIILMNYTRYDVTVNIANA